jgi:hypothetical protein
MVALTGIEPAKHQLGPDIPQYQAVNQRLQSNTLPKLNGSRLAFDVHGTSRMFGDVADPQA